MWKLVDVDGAVAKAIEQTVHGARPGGFTIAEGRENTAKDRSRLLEAASVDEERVGVVLGVVDGVLAVALGNDRFQRRPPVDG
eukprot:6213298-Pleurochrysis_carterae.AAC.2